MLKIKPRGEKIFSRHDTSGLPYYGHIASSSYFWCMSGHDIWWPMDKKKLPIDKKY